MKWFHHDTNSRDDDKIFELIDRQGLQGYGFFWVILEECYTAETTGFQVEVSETWCKRIAKEFGLTDSRTIVRLLDTLAEVKLIDAQMWHEKIICVPGIQKRSDEYMKKRQEAAERKRKQREREKEAKEEQLVTFPSRVTDRDIGFVTPSDLRSQISEFQNTDPEGRSYAHVHAHESEPSPHPDREPEIWEAEIVEPKLEPQPENPGQNFSPVPPSPNSQTMSRRSSSAPVFSVDKNSTPLSVLMKIRPDPSTYEFLTLDSSVKSEMHWNPLRYYPWNCDEKTLELFIRFQVNEMKGNISATEKRSMIESRIREANSSPPLETKKRFMQVTKAWLEFMKNAKASDDFEDVAGETLDEKRVLEVLTRAAAEGRI